MDRFTRTNSERLADEVEKSDFAVDFSYSDSTNSIFAKNPMNEPYESEKPAMKKGLLDNLFEKLEKFLDKKRKSSPTARKFKVMLKFFKVKDTLGRLNKINQSVDELVNLKVPFGEEDKRYQILANRLIRANHLHAEIQKELK